MMLDILSIWLSNFIKFQNAILFFRNFRKNPLKNVTRRNLRNVKQIRPFHISAESRYVFSIFQARSGYVLSLLVLRAHTPFPYQGKFQIRPFHSSATIFLLVHTHIKSLACMSHSLIDGWTLNFFFLRLLKRTKENERQRLCTFL